MDVTGNRVELMVPPEEPTGYDGPSTDNNLPTGGSESIVIGGIANVGNWDQKLVGPCVRSTPEIYPTIQSRSPGK